MTYYYQIAVRAVGGENSLFIYKATEQLQRGRVVGVMLRKSPELGVVWNQARHPNFKTLAINQVYDTILPPPILGLIDWMSTFYATSLGNCLQLVLPAKLPANPKPRNKVSPSSGRPDITNQPLTAEQSFVLKKINQITSGSVLLHGETGSGKTRVYGEVTRSTIKSGQSALLLVPEIGMTEQLSSDIRHYTDDVIISHSAQTPAQRQKTWQRVSSGDPVVVVGTRSAMFLPFNKLGLIVMDEAHDTAYKNESAPRYQSGRVVSHLGALHKATVIFGSATPTVSDYHLAQVKNAPILRMVQQASGQNRSVEIKIIDKRDRTTFTRSQLLSTEALKEISESLLRGEQSLLFLNRRGTARICLCQNCGWNAGCELCDVPLTYHHNRGALLCHSCGREYPLIISCPVCSSVDLSYQSPGVQALTDEVAKLFPNAKTARIDSDSTIHDSLSSRYADLYRGEIDILIGTQSIAKGLDLPNLTLEVIVDSDTSLHLPDYLAGERMFQLLYQVMGRVGRHKPGKVLIQTITPEHPILASAVDRAYDEFYDYEIKARQSLKYPPFSHLARIVVERSSENSAARQAKKLHTEISGLGGVNLRGPSPCYYPKLRGKYRYQLIAMSNHRAQLLKIAPLMSSGDSLDMEPTQLL